MRLTAHPWPLLACLLSAACSQPSRGSADATSLEQASAAARRDIVRASRDDDATPARFDGYGPARFGLDATALRLAWRDPLRGTSEPSQHCSYLSPVAPDGVRFVLADDRLVRYDVERAGEIAPGGGRIDMDLAALRGRYGEAMQVEPGSDAAGVRTLRVRDAATGTALVFEAGPNGRVQRWRVGVPPQVDADEGCG